MTNPFAFLDKDKTTTVQQPSDPFAFLDKKNAKPSPQGFLDYLGNVASNWIKEGDIKSTANAIKFLNPINAAQTLTSPQMQQAAGDMIHVFDHIFNLATPVGAAFEVGQALGQKKEGEGLSASGLAKGIVSPVVDLMELSSGLQLTEDDTRDLTVDEKAQRIKNTMGLVAASAVAGPLATTVGPIGTLAGRIAVNAGIGTVAGATFGAVAGSNDKDQLSQIISGGIMGGSLGTAHTLLFGRKAIRPEEIEQVRQMQVENNTPATTIKLAQALATQDDVASSLVQGKIGLKNGDIVQVPGVNPEQLALLNNKIPEGYRSVMHIDKDGVGRLLVYDETKKIDEQFFQKYGFLRDQIVSYDGDANYKLIGITSEGAHIRNLTGKYNLTVPVDEVRRLPNVEFDTIKATDRIYNDWKTQLAESVPPELREKDAKLKKPGEVDNGAPADIFDSVPDIHQINIDKNLDEWLTAQGFAGDDHSSLKRDMMGRVSAEVLGVKLSPAEKALINAAKPPVTALTTKIKFVTFKQLNRVAKSNGFAISDGGSGRVIVRDAVTRKIIRGFDNSLEAAKWMNKTGQAIAPNVGGAGGNGSLPPEDGIAYANDNIYNYMNNRTNWGEPIIRFLSNIPIITRNQDTFKMIDTHYGTDFYNRVFYPVETASKIRYAKMVPWAEESARIQKNAKLSPEERELVWHHAQTMSPDEIINDFMSRKMNPFEIATAKNIADAGVDIEKIFQYRREFEKLNREFPVEERGDIDPDKEATYQAEWSRMKQAYDIDPKHEQFANLFDQITTIEKDKASLGAIVELARSLNTEGFKGLTQSEFASRNKMSFDAIRVSNQLSDMYKRLAKVFGINEKSILGRYMTHAKLYYDGDVNAAARHFSGDIKTREFYAKMSRTGEISAVETDAFKAIQRYIKAGFDVHTGFAQILADAKTAMNEELMKIPDTLAGRHFRNVVERYIDDMQGYPAAVDKATDSAMQKVFDHLGIDKEANVRAWVNAATNWIAMAGLGARPFLGIGHFGISSIISTSARSLDYTRRVVTAGGKALSDPAVMQSLQESGVLEGLSPLAMMSDAELQSTLKAIPSKTQKLLFKSTLLPTVYDGYAAGHFIITERDALSAITRFQRGDITWNQLKKETFLDRYDAPVVDQFTKLATDPKSGKDAAFYLGKQAVEDLLGTYGRGNHPYLWSTNLGRVTGQFGNFATFVRATVERMASRGTAADRITSVAKLVGISAGIEKLGEELGISLNRLSPFHAMTWTFGPLSHVAVDVVTAIRGSGYESEAAKRRLMKLFPVDSNGDLQPSILVPGSFAIDGLLKALDDINNGNTMSAFAHSLGFQVPKPTGSGL